MFDELSEIVDENTVSLKIRDFFKELRDNLGVDAAAESFRYFPSIYEGLVCADQRFADLSKSDIEYEILRKIIFLDNNKDYSKMIRQLIVEDNIDHLVYSMNELENFKINILKAYIKKGIDKENFPRKITKEERERAIFNIELVRKLKEWKESKKEKTIKELN